MKIAPALQQPTPATEAVENKDKKAETPAQPKSAKRRHAADRVDISASLSAGLQARQDQQAARVESIKSLIKSGSYQVSSRDVAEKMLSGTPDF